MKKRSFRKKAQVTSFIIIGIIIVTVIVAYFLFLNKVFETKLESVLSKLKIKVQASVVRDSILNCLKETAEDAHVVIGIQGGYYKPIKESFDLGWSFIPYYYNEGEFLMPLKEKIEDELEDYVDDNLRYCFGDLPYEDFTLDYKNSKTKATINSKDISFLIDTTLLIQKGDSTAEYKLSETPIIINSALSDILDVASYITESHREDPEMICISCVADMAEERNLYVDMLDFGDETTSLVVISENYTSSEPYIFEFLNKYREF